MLQVPVGLQVYMSPMPWAKVSLPRAGSGMATLQGYPHYDISQGIFGTSRASPAPPAASDLVLEAAGRERGGGAEHRPSSPSSVRRDRGMSTNWCYTDLCFLLTNSGSSGSIHHQQLPSHSREIPESPKMQLPSTFLSDADFACDCHTPGLGTP